MANYYFISYSNADGLEFATRLADDLMSDSPPVNVWLGKRDLTTGASWDDQIVNALSACVGLLFVMTTDSVQQKSVCKDEWDLALSYKKPIVPLRFERDAETPFRLRTRHEIVFSSDYASGLATLRRYIREQNTPKGVLLALRERLADAERDLQRASDDNNRRRIKDEIEQLEQQIANQEAVIHDPAGVSQRNASRVKMGVAEDRQNTKSITSAGQARFVHSCSFTPPSYFQNRHVETGLVGTFLKEPGLRLMTIAGRGGVGKTAMVNRLLKSVESGHLPDDGGAFNVDGIIYLGPRGGQYVRFPELYNDLCELLPDASQQLLESILKNPHSDSKAKTQALLENFPQGCTVVLLDNFEDVVDAVNGKTVDGELRDALTTLLDAPHHGLKILITTRVAPQDLLLTHPERQMLLELDKGLGSPYAETILRKMDWDGSLGLRDAPDPLLDQARIRTRGYPRALEALVAILRADRVTTLQQILNDTEQLLPENVVEKLVGEAFSRLDPRMQQILQALAVYSRPVPSSAIDYLLQPHQPGIDAGPLLKRLVSMEFARCEEGHCWLHPVDNAFALERIPKGQCSDWQGKDNAAYTRCSLQHRAAEYFREIRIDESLWTTLNHVDPLIAEFELLIATGDLERASEVLETLWPYLYNWGYSRQISRLAGELLDRGSGDLRAKAAGISGTASYALGDLDEAVSYLRLALDTVNAEANPEDVAGWRFTLAEILSSQGAHEQAAKEYQRALDDADEEDKSTRTSALLGLGSVDETNNRYDEAAAHYREALIGCITDMTLSVTETGDDQFDVVAVPLAPELPIDNPWAWYPMASIEIKGNDGPILLLMYGIAAEVVEEEGSPETEPEETLDTDEAESEPTKHSAVLISSELGDVWMSFAGLLTRKDRPEDAASCCRIAVGIYDMLGQDSGIVNALNMLHSLAAELPDTDADAILKILEESLDRVRESGNRQLELFLLNNLAEAYLERGDTDRAQSNYSTLSKFAQELEDPAWAATARRGLARIDVVRGDPKTAVNELQSLLTERQGDPQFLADTKMLLGAIEYDRHQRDNAAKHYEAASHLCSMLGQLANQVTAEKMLAVIEMEDRAYDDAVKRLEKMLPVARESGASLTASLLCTLADAYFSAGDRDNAIYTGRAVYEITSDIELPSTQAETLMSLGNLLLRMEMFDEAEGALHEARAIYQRSANISAEITALLSLSRLYSRTERYDTATEVAREAWNLAQQLGDQIEIDRVRLELALALSDAGQHNEAVEHAQALVDRYPHDGLRAGNLGWVSYQAGDYDRCITESARALDLDAVQTWVIRNMGHAYLAKGQPDEAEREYRRAIEDRKGGEDFLETIREIKRLLAKKPNLPRGQKLLDMIEQEQRKLVPETTEEPGTADVEGVD
jgi:tetratricopeptide (TPR) repeat protein